MTLIPRDIDLRELGITLHIRLLNKTDNRVTAELSEVFLPLLISDLRRKFPNLRDPHLVQTVATDTLITYFEHPERFDPAKSPLIGYLYMDAYGNLRNILMQQQIFVELHPHVPEHEVIAAIAGDDPEQELIEKSSPLVQRTIEHLTDSRDRELVLMMMDGVRETSAYAEVLGIQDRPIGDQVRAVKQHKDRLKKALRRKVATPRKQRR
jgi:DNA-directed RNA polymerase specialized sigma24 family protein